MIARPESIYWTDLNQRHYLDFTSGEGVMPLGWGYTRMVNAAADQCYSYSYVGPQGSHIEWRQVVYASAISERFPEVDGAPQQVLYANSSDHAKALVAKMIRGPVLTPEDVVEQGLLTPQTGAVAMEFVPADLGFPRLDSGLAQIAAEQAKNMGVPVIAVETHTAYGRTGSFLAQEEWNVKADITILGESGGGGFAFGAVVAAPKYFEHLDVPPLVLPGLEVACATGLVVLEEISEPVLDNVRDVGVVLEENLNDLARQFPELIRGCTGYGMARGLVTAGAVQAAEIVRRSVDQGLILSVCGGAKQVIRITPPLIISDTEAKRGIDLIAAVLLDM